MPNHLQRAFAEIDTCPLYFISTHGFYDMDKYAAGTPMITTVPENTIVIETTMIGSYCLFTNLLIILKKLLVNRTKLVEYLGGNPTDDPLVQKIILTALSTCQFYLPGGTIPNRILEATGGIYRSSERMESERTGDYGNMGFYKYIPGSEEPEKIFTERYSELVAGAYGQVKGKGAKVNNSNIPFETFETMFQRINDLKDTFKIIFFSSCGEIRDTEPSSLARIQEIRGIQNGSFDIWNSKIRVNYNEARLALRDIPFKQEIADQFGLTLTDHIPRELRNFSDPQIPALSMVLRSATKKGGSRRFVKKSKSKRKSRKFKRSL
jgi:hypothetical protein